MNTENINFDENDSSEEEDNCKANIFENKELTKKKTKVKILENDFHEIYEDEDNNKEEEFLEKKKEKKEKMIKPLFIILKI